MFEEAGLKGLSEAERIQVLGLRKLTPGQRVDLAFKFTDLVLRFARGGIRAGHPDFSEEEVERELHRRMFGKLPEHRDD
ncbi:MAG: hypothetical protein ABIH04_09845 [Planctomycetota bacterium]